MRIYGVDAFTSRAFTGNPAAVCLADRERSGDWMQSVAAEMNLSETAFVMARHAGYNLRWFTPETEVALCGHATLAAAHVLYETATLAPSDEARFHTASGALTVRAEGHRLAMDFPAEPAAPVPTDDDLLDALGVEAVAMGRNRMDYLVHVAEARTVVGLEPDMAALRRIDTRGAMVTAEWPGPEYDFVSRFFAPRAGVPEDPVTGSAHCCLGPFWAELLGRSELTGYQASPRGGVVEVRVADRRVLLLGRAVTVWQGELLA